MESSLLVLDSQTCRARARSTFHYFHQDLICLEAMGIDAQPRQMSFKIAPPYPCAGKHLKSCRLRCKCRTYRYVDQLIFAKGRCVAMTLNQGKFRPTISAIDEVDDRNLKLDENKQQIEGSETAPLTTNQLKLNIDENLSRKDGLQRQNACGDSEQQAETPTSGVGGSINGFRGRASLDALMRLSRKRRILYITTACLCAVLLVIIILLIAFWPEVPFYLRAELCLEKECVQASQQLLLWSNSSRNPCHQTYEWACGNFAQDYADNDYFVIKRGEWDYKTYNEFKELNELNRFISMLPTSAPSYSVESMVSSLYRSCREIDTLDKSQSDLLVRKAIKLVAELRKLVGAEELRTEIWDTVYTSIWPNWYSRQTCCLRRMNEST
uniref:Uncharacterized protein n=1 Tax=Glossina pallidipes TaxID=7398 RepID=A0A1A9ZIE7_GLOPL